MKIIGIGVDIIANARIRHIITQNYSSRFLLRVLNPNY